MPCSPKASISIRSFPLSSECIINSNSCNSRSASSGAGNAVFPCMETNISRTSSESEEDIPADASSATRFLSGETQGLQHSTQKPQTTSDDLISRDSRRPSENAEETDNATVRMMLRSCTYFLYDGVSDAGGHKEVARIGKVVIELLLDEQYPPPHRSDMSIRRKCTEYLIAPAVSSLTWFIIRTIQTSKRKHPLPRKSKATALTWLKALWTVVHRVGRQALIYRLFFRIGSLRYSLASLLGIICCFFKESIFPELLHLGKWPSHFSPSQGFAALFRSVVYAISFSIPVQNFSKALQESARRRGNVKKLIFAVILSHLRNAPKIHDLVATSQSWTV